MKKKVLSVILAGVMACGLMAGCGSTAEAPAEEAATETTEEAEAPAEDEAAAPEQVYRIGICQLVQHAALDAATQGFEDALVELLGEDGVEFDYQDAAGDSATCATIVNNFVADGVDLILANATAPLQAASTATTDIPVLGTSVTDYATALDIADWTGSTGINVSGTCDLAPLDQQAAMIQELFPDCKKVGILYCSAEPNSKYQATKITEYLTELGIEAEEFSFADSNDIAAVTQTACDGSDVIYIPTDNTAASCTATIDPIATDAQTPIVAGEAGICEGCGVATLSISYYSLGYETGKMAYEVLVNGADVSTMEVQYAGELTKQYMADRCEALGVTVPDDYEAITAE